MNVRKMMVIGAGQMGSGIAQVAAESGLTVLLNDMNDELIQEGFSRIQHHLEKRVKNNKINEEEMALVLSRIVPSNDLRDAHDVDVVVEAVVEKMEVKKSVFQTLERICPSHTILASNTSSLPITEIAACTQCPERVIGMHFMNPVHAMKLVEVIRGLATSEETFKVVKSLAQTMGKVAVEVQDFPGFIANRILIPMINEAIFCIHEGVGTIESVDQVLKLGMNHPMGPLELADFIGLDTCLYIMETLHEGLGDSKYRPCPLLRKYVMAGWLGKKSGRGFYDYSIDKSKR
ncbi:MAG: 3-hydroxybutyryl-CoA dehydrogenase [Paenibacillaceae bacterium]